VRFDDLLGWESRAAEGADLPCGNQVAQRGERFLDIGRGIGAVHLVEVDPVGLEASQAVLESPDDPPPRVPGAVRPLLEWEMELAGQDQLLTAGAQQLTEDRLGFSGRIHVGGIDEVDSSLQRRVEDLTALVVVAVASEAEHHRSKAVGTDLDPGPSEPPVVHNGHAIQVTVHKAFFQATANTATLSI
jgi:hypothetical protein